MASLKAWLIKPNDPRQEPYIQNVFPMMDLDNHDVRPLYLHPTAPQSVDISMIEKRFEIDELQGNLMHFHDLPAHAQVWD